jgi:DNA-binding CsgD family transcriptional regulator
LLSDREIEIIWYVSLGLTNKQIAARLYVEVNTVKSHLLRASQKLGTHSRAGLVGECYRRRLLRVPSA